MEEKLEEGLEYKSEEEEEETEVTKFVYNGECYLKSENNILFDIIFSYLKEKENYARSYLPTLLQNNS